MSVNIIDFLAIKEQREQQALEKLFQQANTQTKLQHLLVLKQLDVNDHQMFLAFLAYAEQQRLKPERLFKDVIKLPKHEFQQKYRMNWYSIVQLAATFLTIVQESDKDAYNNFMNQLNDCRNG